MADTVSAHGSDAGDRLETAILGGGCFWCIEAVLQRLQGVVSVESGYAGGASEKPTYEQVCSGKTGHAEVVQVRFDPARLSFPTLLEVFFSAHDPTTLNRQGNDIGTQYRSVVYCQNQQQRDSVINAIAALEASGRYGSKVVTEVAGQTPFYLAESLHQNYFARNGHAPYCRQVVAPKVTKSQSQFAGLMREN